MMLTFVQTSLPIANLLPDCACGNTIWLPTLAPGDDVMSSMTQLKAASTATFPLQITDPERIPARRYYDEEFYKLECERLWPHVWQMACRLEEIPKSATGSNTRSSTSR